MPRIQHKRGTSANLASVNPTPLEGELVWDSTENAIKIGDGATAWASLAYVTATPRSHVHDGADITTGTIDYARLPVGSTTSTVCAGDDARLYDARTPTSHKASHATGGSDALTPSDIGAAPAASPTFTGVITVSATSGSAGSYLPSLTFSGDPNTGFGQVSGQSDSASVFTAGHERVRVRSDGNVGIASAGVAHIGLLVQNTLNSADARSAIFCQPKLTSSFTSDFTGVTSGVELQTNAAITNTYTFLARNATIASGASVTNQYGLVVPASFTAGTNNYAMLLGIPSGSNRWNIYASGTADNYFNGDCGIKTDGPTAALDINSDTIRLRTAKTPSSASDTGNAGDICWDASYLYICTATNTWRRIAHSTW